MGVSKLHGKVARAAVSVALSGTMALSGLLAAPVTAFAASPALTISGIDKTTTKAGIAGWQIFKLTGTQKTTDTDANGREVATAATVEWAGDKDGTTGFTPVEAAVVNHLMGLNGNAYYNWLIEKGYMAESDTANKKTTVEHTARIAMSFIKEQIDASAGSMDPSRFVPNAGTFAVKLAQDISKVTADVVLEDTNGSAEISAAADDSYWLFLPVTTDTDDDNKTIVATNGIAENAIPLFVARTDDVTSVGLKNAYASLEKKVLDENGDPVSYLDASKGQVFTYQLTATISTTAGSEDNAVITDTVESGIDIDSDSFVVKKNGTALSNGYTVESNGNKYTITIASAESATYTVTYEGEFNNDAKMGLGAGEKQGFNKNSAELEYKTQKTVASVANVASYQLELFEYDKDTEAGIAGSKFTISTGEGDAKQYLQADGSMGRTAETFTVGADGLLHVDHIDSGKYTVKVAEDGTPHGYNELAAEEFTIEIPQSFKTDGTAKDEYTVTVKGVGGSGVTTQAEVDVASGLVKVKVPYSKTIYLPITGMTPSQLGTIMGAALVAAGAIAIAMRRRNAAE